MSFPYFTTHIRYPKGDICIAHDIISFKFGRISFICSKEDYVERQLASSRVNLS